MSHASASLSGRARPHNGAVRFGSSAQSALNNRFAIALVIFLAMVPIPLGSNRPVFWALSGLVLAAVALLYMGLLLRKKSQFRHSPAQLKSLMVPYFGLLGFIILQMIPFGSWVSPIKIAIGDAIVVSSTMSLTPGMSFLSLIQFASYSLLFFLMLQIAYNSERAHKMMVTLFMIIVAYAAFALFALTQFGDPILLFEKSAYQGSATATFINRNSFATFLSFGLVAGLVFTAGSLLPESQQTHGQKGPLTAALYLLGSSVIFAALLATQSRMGFAAGAIGALVGTILVLSKAPRAHRLIWPVLLFGILGTIVLFFLYGSGLLERVGSVESSSDVRMALYEQVIKMIAARPWTGYGAGSFELAFPLFHQLPVSPDVVWDKTHNTYLALWSDFGIVFGSIPILLIAMISVSIWRIFRTARIRWTNAAIALGVITTAAIHSLADFSLEIEAVAYLFVAILAIGMAGPPKNNSVTTRSIPTKDDEE
ncbi:hypothetical protein MNBD_ALPHA12-1390 [hydrothermal vent metagenome]|uniref:O-antigen ligase-related domain-containing protein n=1 Tax=hydrothermal vent metagenome TaxID=652676 RepID=A0A3B0TVU5_9ZZZZ